MAKLRSLVLLVRHLGPRWVAFRVRYALRRRTGGLIRRCPIGPWCQAAATASDRATDLFSHRPVTIGPACMAEAEEILAGRFRLFSFHAVDAGFPPRWNQNALTGAAARADVHWSEVGEFAFGDIKCVWELNRFGWAFPLARAYAHSGDERYAEGFWQLLDDWMKHNPPNRGPGWMCGQEATFRLMAATFGRYVCTESRATTPARILRYHSLVVTTARRISANLDYALSQSNNHGVSECIGLITALVIASSDPAADSWRETGFEELEKQIDALVYRDGGFSQHSAIYHRVLLQDLLWCITLLRARRTIVPGWLEDAARRALRFIDGLMTPETGRVPLYGANDGSNILPLADADYLDFRPTVQAGYAVLENRRRLAPGPWDEAAEWLTGRNFEGLVGIVEDQNSRNAVDQTTEDRGQTAEDRRAETNVGRPSGPLALRPSGVMGATHFPDGGCLVWRSGDSRLFLRCPTRFRHRPSQADMLHVDVEWRGQAIAHDAGTFSYNAEGQFAGALKAASVHNSVTFDGREPMEKFSRFLYLPWSKGKAGWNEEKNSFRATHDGWRRLGIDHRRNVSSPASGEFVIRDEIKAEGRHRARLHWLLSDLPYEFEPTGSRLVMVTPAGNISVKWEAPLPSVTLIRADPKSDRGWWSPHYQRSVPALSLAIEFEFTDQAVVTSRFEPLET